MALKKHEVWFVTGSQHLCGNETLRQVDKDSAEIARALDESPEIPVRVVFKPVLTNPEAIARLCIEANAAEDCAGFITWMHPFSPAKMWIAGLKTLHKPFLHLHTQFNRDIPWADIDMDFMNLNQSAHGGREFGHICARLGLKRKVVVGHWQEPEVQQEVGVWARAACGWLASQNLRVARFGDNMREVAVTEGDKVEAQIWLGWSVNGYGVGELTERVDSISDAEIDRIVAEYEADYGLAADVRENGRQRQALRDAARIEAGMRAFLEEGGFQAFTTTFEHLHGLKQLPGLAVQRLMADGYGFGAEGDWKTAALVRIMKVMAEELTGGTSFMEDYTYHLDPAGPKVLGAHMLEVCPSIAEGTPSLEVHPLGIGGKEAPARLVFDAGAGPAINASLIDMGDRFRLIVNDIDVIVPDAPLPKLPVARALWVPQPDLKTSATAWILAGAAHHSAFSQSLGQQHMEGFAEIFGIELLVIDKDTRIRDFKREIW